MWAIKIVLLLFLNRPISTDSRLPPVRTLRLKTSLTDEENLREKRRDSVDIVNDCMLRTDRRTVTAAESCAILQAAL